MRVAAFLSLILVAVAAAQERSSISIQGHVYAEDTGGPASGAKVKLTGVNEFNFRRQAGETTTNEQGAFVLDGLTPGRYTLSVEKADYLAEFVQLSRPANEIVVRLRRAAIISGRVLDRDGQIVRKALVEVMKKNHMYGEVSLQAVSAAFAWTDDLGRYRVAGLAPGRYYVRSSCDGYDTNLYPGASGLAGAQSIELVTGSERNEIDFRLRPAPGFTLEGRLIDFETEGAAQAKFLRAQSADLIAGTFVDGVIHDGHFRLEGLKRGRYFLNFTWVGATNNVTRTAVLPFEMGDADQSGVILRVGSRVTVAGRLKSGGEKQPGPLSVYLEPTVAAVRAHIGGSSAAANVAPDGTFKMAGVPPGQYHLRVHSGEPARFFVAERIVVVDGRAPIAGVELDLDFSAGSVSGKALDVAGNPIPGASVVLQSVDSDKFDSDLYRHVFRAGGTGSFSITGVVPGEYVLFAWRDDAGLVGDPDLFAQALQHARRVTVGPRGALSEAAIEMRNP
jgi:protocatechuate 3,4-dioxygenase beta subunit